MMPQPNRWLMAPLQPAPCRPGAVCALPPRRWGARRRPAGQPPRSAAGQQQVAHKRVVGLVIDRTFSPLDTGPLQRQVQECGGLADTVEMTAATGADQAALANLIQRLKLRNVAPLFCACRYSQGG